MHNSYKLNNYISYNKLQVYLLNILTVIDRLFQIQEPIFSFNFQQN